MLSKTAVPGEAPFLLLSCSGCLVNMSGTNRWPQLYLPVLWLADLYWEELHFCFAPLWETSDTFWVQVYAVTVYVEGEKAARELGVRQRGGFFDDNRCRTTLLSAFLLLTMHSLVPHALIFGVQAPRIHVLAHSPILGGQAASYMSCRSDPPYTRASQIMSQRLMISNMRASSWSACKSSVEVATYKLKLCKVPAVLGRRLSEAFTCGLWGGKLVTLCRDEDYALALVDGAFTKAIVVQLVRKVEGKQFYEVCGSHILHPMAITWAAALSVPTT